MRDQVAVTRKRLAELESAERQHGLYMTAAAGMSREAIPHVRAAQDGIATEYDRGWLECLSSFCRRVIDAGRTPDE